MVCGLLVSGGSNCRLWVYKHGDPRVLVNVRGPEPLRRWTVLRFSYPERRVSKQSSPSHDANMGAYGLAVSAAIEPELLVPAEASWPRWAVSVEIGERPATFVEVIGDAQSEIPTSPNGYMTVSRTEATTVVRVRSLSHHALPHPYLGSTAVLTSPWLGRTSMHAGAFVVDGRVWGVLAGRDGGKSSTLAWFAVNDIAVFADDVLVLSRERAFAAPRVIDLRAGAAEHFGVGVNIGVVGARERWRVRLAPVPGELPMAGWVAIEWGDRVEVSMVGAAERGARLSEGKALLRPERDPLLWLSVISLPMIRLSRPKDWGKIGSAMAILLDAIAAVSAAKASHRGPRANRLAGPRRELGGHAQPGFDISSGQSVSPLSEPPAGHG